MSQQPPRTVIQIRHLWIAAICFAILLGALWVGYQLGKNAALKRNAEEAAATQPKDERRAE